MKRIIPSLIMLLCVATLFAQRAIYIDDILYLTFTETIDGEEVTCAKIESTRTPKEELVKLVIPDSIQIDKISYPVTIIGKNVFSGAISLTEVIFNHELREIEANAFKGCSALKSLEFNTCLRSIGKEAFTGCQSLANVEFGEELRSIGDKAFMGCSSLKSVIIPSNTERIGEDAFNECSSLETMVIEDSKDVLYMGYNICKDILLKELYLGREYKKENNPYANDPLFIKAENITIGNCITVLSSTFYNHTNLKKIKLPETLKKITEKCFKGCTALSEIEFPESLETIDYGSFANSGLKKVNLLNVKTLGSSVFQNCKDLVEVTGDSLSYIAWSAFEGCSSLKKITLPESLSLIGQSAFNGCSSLKTIQIPAGIKAFNTETFKGCDFSTFTIPATLDSIGENALYCRIDTLIIEYASKPLRLFNWYGLELDLRTHYTNPVNFRNIYLNRAIKYYKTIDGFYDGQYYSYVTDSESPFFSGNIQSVTFGPNLTSLGSYYFSNCKNIKDIFIPWTLTLSEGIFFYSGLSEVTFEEGVTTIPSKAFAGCKNLHYITLPSSIDMIGDESFGNVDLTSIMCHPTTPPVGEGNPFSESTYQNAILYVPTASLNLYKTSWPWIKFVNIHAMESEMDDVVLKGDVSIEVNDGTITVVNAAQPVEVYTTDGRKVASSVANGTVTGLPTGLYIVRCGSEVSKIYVR